MADTIESEFIASFHSLTGITAKERTKNFYGLLNKTLHLLQHLPGKINLSSLIPRNPLEERFKIIALINFKCAVELLNVFKSENPMLIDIVLKHSSWIIKQAFIDITPEYLATQFFPNISYNSKLKLLNQLSYHLHDTYRADQYFDVVREYYGYFLASKLLPACSSDVILKCIRSYKTEITPKQLLLILKKYPTLTETILSMLDNQNPKTRLGEKYQSVFKYISKADPALFIKLYEEYSPNIHLGAKESDCFIKNSLKLNVFKKHTELYKILKSNQIGKSLGNDFNDFYLAFFPKRISHVKDNLRSICKLLGYLNNNSEKLKIFSNTFEKIYGNEIWEYPELKQEFLIEWMSPDERDMWMRHSSKPTKILEETWIAYYKTEKSIPLLKEQISLTSNINARSKLICTLLKTCKLNKDESSLLDVLKYVNLKHRNDHTLVITDFLSTFNSFYNEHQLKEEHWNEIFQCIQLFTLNKGSSYYIPIILEKCVCYRLHHNLTINKILEFMMKYYNYDYNICARKPKFQKICLKKFEDLIPLGYSDKDLNTGYIRYLYHLYSYNQANPKNKLTIDLKDEYFKCLQESLKGNGHKSETQAGAAGLILLDYNRADAEGLLELFFGNDYYFSYERSVLEHLMKENPMLLLKYFKLIMDADGYNYFIPSFVRTYCRQYAYLDISDQISKLCYEAISDEEVHDVNKIKNSIHILSMATTPQKYTDFSRFYYPAESTSDLDCEVNQIHYIKEQAVARNIKNLIPISQTLDNILQFSKGDYLKFAQISIGIAANNVAEHKLIPFFGTLKSRAVSVRKHAIFLSCRVLNKNEKNRLFLDFKQKEKNASLLKVLLKTIFRTFLTDPDDYIWNLTKQFMATLDCSDEEAFVILTSCRQVPLEFFGKYLEFTWNMLGKYTGSNKTIEEGRVRLLNLINPTNISNVPQQFCTQIVEHFFQCKELTDLQKACQDFTSTYFIWGPGTTEERFEIVFNLFKDFKDNNLNNIGTRSSSCRLIYNFVKLLCSDIMRKECSNKGVFVHYLSKWKDILQPSETFDEFVHLELTSLYVEAFNKKLNIAEVGKGIASICNFLHEKNCFVAQYFCNHLLTFLENFYALESIGNSDENEITLIKSVVDNRTSYKCLELALYLLPCSIPITSIVKEKYNYIIDVIAKESNHKVQIIFNTYLRNLSIHNV